MAGCCPSLISRICQQDGVTVVMVAHDVNPILQYLDQVIYLAHGGAVMGPPEQVITADTLTMLYGTPIDVLRDQAGRLVVVGQPDTSFKILRISSLRSSAILIYGSILPD